MSGACCLAPLLGSRAEHCAPRLTAAPSLSQCRAVGPDQQHRATKRTTARRQRYAPRACCRGSSIPGFTPPYTHIPPALRIMAVLGGCLMPPAQATTWRGPRGESTGMNNTGTSSSAWLEAPLPSAHHQWRGSKPKLLAPLSDAPRGATVHPTATSSAQRPSTQGLSVRAAHPRTRSCARAPAHALVFDTACALGAAAGGGPQDFRRAARGDFPSRAFPRSAT